MFLLIILGFFVLILVAGVINAKKVEKEKIEKRKAHHERLERQRIKQEKLDRYRNENPHLIEFNFAVKGLYYRNYDEKEAAKKLELGDKLILEWDKYNAYDALATKVCTQDGYFIGFVDASINVMLHYFLDDIVTCMVSKIDNPTGLPFIYAEAYFERFPIDNLPFDSAKKFLRYYGYYFLSKGYYSKEIKLKKADNLLYCISKLKENHTRTNFNIIQAAIFDEVLRLHWRYCEPEQQDEIERLIDYYDGYKDKKNEIGIDDWKKVIEFLEF